MSSIISVEKADFLLPVFILIHIFSSSCSREVDDTAYLCKDVCDSQNCTYKYDGIGGTKSDKLTLTFNTPFGTKEYSSDWKVSVPVSVADNFSSVKMRAVLEGSFFQKDAILEKNYNKDGIWRCLDAKGTSSDCYKYSNCGCSGTNKNDCGGLCCV